MTVATSAHVIDMTRARLCYLVRGLWKRIDWERIPQHRRRGISMELLEQLYPIAISERSTLGWVRHLATRFEMVLTSWEKSAWPASAIVHDSFVGDASGDLGADVPPSHTRVRWDVLANLIPFDALRIVLHDGASMVATFATAEPIEDEHTLFPISAPSSPDATWRPTLPKSLISPRAFRAVWTTTSPLHHGHDVKSGNVSLFRRQLTIDPTTGQTHLVPFISGNAVRGTWRDLIFSRLFQLVGLRFKEVPPQRANAFLAGGTIEAGTDGQKVDVALRRRARDMCPAWDLIAGCIDGQIMKGLLHVGDAEVVCRENAWKLHAMLAPDVDFEVFRASLKTADELTQLRLMTRHKHADVSNSDNIQMLLNVESLLPGTQLVQSFTMHGLNGISTLARSCMADLLEEFRSEARIGAKTASGSGVIAFDGYEPGEGVEALGAAAEYIQWAKANAAEIRAWLCGTTIAETQAQAVPVDDEKPTAKRGRKTTKKDPDAAPELF